MRSLKDLATMYSVTCGSFNDWDICFSIDIRKLVTVAVWDDDIVNMELLPTKVYRFVAGLISNKPIDDYSIEITPDMIDNKYRIKFHRYDHEYESFDNGFVLEKGVVEDEDLESVGVYAELPLKDEVNQEVIDLIKEREEVINNFIYEVTDSIKDKTCEFSIQGKIEGIEEKFEKRKDLDEDTINKIVSILKEEANKDKEEGEYFIISRGCVICYNKEWHIMVNIRCGC